MDLKKIENFIDRIVDWRIPGAECEIYIENKPVFNYSAGYADVEMKKPIKGSLYFLYSCTKVSTAVALMQLLEKGDILLDDPVKEYLPEYAEMYIEKEVEPGKKELLKAQNDITIKHLASMTAGFDYNWKLPAIDEVRNKTNGKSPTREVVRAISKAPLYFEPGTHWSYSLCYDVLGGLIEVVSGKRLSNYFKENIFDVCGMQNTTMRFEKKIEKNMSKQYFFDGEKTVCIKLENEHSMRIGSDYDSGGAGIISSVGEYVKLASALANKGIAPNGERVLSDSAIELMRSDFLDNVSRKDVNWSQLKGYSYGCGVRTMIDKAAGGSLSPIGEFGWSGAAGSYFLSDPKNKLAILYTQQLLNNQEAYVHPRLRNIIYSALEF